MQSNQALGKREHTCNTILLFQMFLSLCVLVVLAAAAHAQQGRPAVSDTTLEDALNDKRFIARQLKCALGEAPCDPIGKRLKSKAF